MLYFSWLSRFTLNSSKYAHFILRLNDSIWFCYFSFNTICTAFDIQRYAYMHTQMYRHCFITTFRTYNNIMYAYFNWLCSFHPFVWLSYSIQFGFVYAAIARQIKFITESNIYQLRKLEKWGKNRSQLAACVRACERACIVRVCLFVWSKNNNTLNFRFMFRLRSTSALFCSHIEIFDWQFLWVLPPLPPPPPPPPQPSSSLSVSTSSSRVKVYKILRNIRTNLKRLLPFCKTFCTRCTCKI